MPEPLPKGVGGKRVKGDGGFATGWVKEARAPIRDLYSENNWLRIWKKYDCLPTGNKSTEAKHYTPIGQRNGSANDTTTASNNKSNFRGKNASNPDQMCGCRVSAEGVQILE
ncbi:hypothetical protein PTI98_000024 [Pleurotus ostreatus]|nr:hypothetical protein PTI98_000024 [Pleurotus ostreatus]